MSVKLILDEAAISYQSALEALGCKIHFETGTTITDDLTDCDVLLASAPLAEAYLEAGYRANWIQSTWAGVARLIPLISGKDICLTGIKGVFGPLIAEYVFSYMLSDIRHTHRSSVAQKEHQWDFFEPGTLQGKVFLAIGTGSIGTHVSSVARVFGMKTIGVSHGGSPNSCFDQIYSRDKIVNAVAGADYIMLSVPETQESYHLVDRAVLNAVKPGAMLFNVGRGGTLDTDAMIDALTRGILRAAVLDVFKEEPLHEADVLWDTPGVTVTPHLAAVSHPEVIAQKFLVNLERYESGDALLDLIDTGKGY